MVTKPESGKETQALHLSLVLEAGREIGQEVLNNYGLKSNGELILGYGFSISNNPDDCVVIKLGGEGTTQKRTEIGRDLEGLQEVIGDMKEAYRKQVEDVSEELECELDVVDMLREMTNELWEKLVRCEDVVRKSGDKSEGRLRKSVVRMCQEYIEGECRGERPSRTMMSDNCIRMQDSGTLSVK